MNWIVAINILTACIWITNGVVHNNVLFFYLAGLYFGIAFLSRKKKANGN